VISLDGAGPLMVEGDPAQLRSVLANLLANALRHTPRGTPVEVSVAAIGHEARIAVRDHGPGLAPGDEEHVFERFWRHGEGRGRADGGAGLGLAIVAAVANAHHGRATASNAAGGGALFQVFLPWADEGDERREERRPE
jgi:two-component system OmpR family sensor kinase